MNDAENDQAGQNDEKTVVLSARAMRTLVMNQFGEEIAGSRKFNAIPSLELTDRLMLVWKCPMPDCKGEMHYTGESWMSFPPAHHHKCTRCSFTAAITGATFGPDV